MDRFGSLLHSRISRFSPQADRWLLLILGLIGTWLILSIWGLIPLLTNVAIIGVFMFFILWFAKDLFLDDFLAGVHLSRRILPGSPVILYGKEYRLVEIGALNSILSASNRWFSVPNRMLLHAMVERGRMSSRRQERRLGPP